MFVASRRDVLTFAFEDVEYVQAGLFLVLGRNEGFVRCCRKRNAAFVLYAVGNWSSRTDADESNEPRARGAKTFMPFCSVSCSGLVRFTNLL